MARLTIGSDGKVTACEIIDTSGNESLDATTCAVMRRRFLYEPARDGRGRPVTHTTLQTVQWVLPSTD